MGRQDGVVFARMALSGGNIADATVAMLAIVPTHKVMAPGARRFQIGKAMRREFRAVFGNLEQRFNEGVIVRHSRTRIRRLDAQPVEHGQHGGGLEGAAVVAMKHGFVRYGVNSFGQRSALEQGDGAVSCWMPPCVGRFFCVTPCWAS